MNPHPEHLMERYLTGATIHPKDRDSLFSHMNDCLSCRRFFDEFIHLSGSAGAPAEGKPRTRDLSLDLVLPSLLDEVGSEAVLRPKRHLRIFALVFATTAAAFLALFVLRPSPDENGLSAKGGAAARVILEAICFDADTNVTKRLRQSGTCPAPGRAKFLLGTAAIADSLSVLVVSGTDVQLFAEYKNMKSGDLLADYADLRPNSTLKIFAWWGTLMEPKTIMTSQLPVLEIVGADP